LAQAILAQAREEFLALFELLYYVWLAMGCGGSAAPRLEAILPEQRKPYVTWMKMTENRGAAEKKGWARVLHTGDEKFIDLTWKKLFHGEPVGPKLPWKIYIGAPVSGFIVARAALIWIQIHKGSGAPESAPITAEMCQKAVETHGGKAAAIMAKPLADAVLAGKTEIDFGEFMKLPFVEAIPIYLKMCKGNDSDMTQQDPYCNYYHGVHSAVSHEAHKNMTADGGFFKGYKWAVACEIWLTICESSLTELDLQACLKLFRYPFCFFTDVGTGAQQSTFAFNQLEMTKPYDISALKRFFFDGGLDQALRENEILVKAAVEEAEQLAFATDNPDLLVKVSNGKRTSLHATMQRFSSMDSMTSQSSKVQVNSN